MICLFFVVFIVCCYCFLLYSRLSYDNFSSYSVRRYSLDETDRSAHPGSAEVVIKPITSSNESPRWAQWPRVAGRGGLRRVFILKNDLLKGWKRVFA